MRECRYRRTNKIPFDVGELTFNSCVLAGEGIMVHEQQCNECKIDTWTKSFHCRHMRPTKRFTSGGGSEEKITCSKKQIVMDENCSACETCRERIKLALD